jgi:hypothetical protein
VIEGFLKKNSIGRWAIEDLELTSGASVDLRIAGNWISGSIECWSGDYYWFSRGDGVPVVLNSSIMARALPGRYTNG